MSEPQLRILFVCLGNTCRSPLAEGVLRHRLADEGLDARVLVESAGTHARADRTRPHPLAARVAREHRIALSSGHPRAFEPEDFDRFDWIVAFDPDVLDAVRRLARSEDERRRVSAIVDDGIDDPYGGDEAEYARTYEQIEAACERLIGEIRAELAK